MDLKTEDGSEATVQEPVLKHFPQRNRIIDSGRTQGRVRDSDWVIGHPDLKNLEHAKRLGRAPAVQRDGTGAY